MVDVATFCIHVDEMVGDEGGRDAAEGDQMGVELLASVELSGLSVGLDELSQNRWLLHHVTGSTRCRGGQQSPSASLFRALYATLVTRGRSIRNTRNIYIYIILV